MHAIHLFTNAFLYLRAYVLGVGTLSLDTCSLNLCYLMDGLAWLGLAGTSNRTINLFICLHWLAYLLTLTLRSYQLGLVGTYNFSITLYMPIFLLTCMLTCCPPFTYCLTQLSSQPLSSLTFSTYLLMPKSIASARQARIVGTALRTLTTLPSTACFTNLKTYPHLCPTLTALHLLPLFDGRDTAFTGFQNTC